MGVNRSCKCNSRLLSATEGQSLLRISSPYILRARESNLLSDLGPVSGGEQGKVSLETALVQNLLIAFFVKWSPKDDVRLTFGMKRSSG